MCKINKNGWIIKGQRRRRERVKPGEGEKRSKFSTEVKKKKT